MKGGSNVTIEARKIGLRTPYSRLTVSGNTAGGEATKPQQNNRSTADNSSKLANEDNNRRVQEDFKRR